MRIIIVGAGVVGRTLAEELSDDGHTVSVIDRNAALIRRIQDRMDVLAIRGNGALPSILRQAGIEHASMVIAVTDIDEVNLVISMVAKRFGVQHKIARLRSEEYAGAEAALRPDALGIDTVISPENIIVSTLRRIIDIPGATDVATFAEGKVLLVMFDIQEDAPIASKRLAELRDAAKMHAFLVVAIFRNEKPFVPRGDDTIEPGDEIAVLLREDHIPLFLPLVQPEMRRCQRVVIYGGDLVGTRLARDLQHQLDKVVLIEPKPEVAQAVAGELEQTLVLQGEGTEPELLREADVAHCDFFMALSKDDEANLLAALMAKRQGAPKAAVVTQSPEYVSILDNIGINVVLNPRLVTVGEILRHLRAGHVHTVTRLKESEAEVLEMEALEGSKMTKKPLKEIEFPNGSIIGAVLRDNEMLIPDGNFCIEAGERVLIFALPKAIDPVVKLFGKRRFLS